MLIVFWYIFMKEIYRSGSVFFEYFLEILGILGSIFSFVKERKIRFFFGRCGESFMVRRFSGEALIVREGSRGSCGGLGMGCVGFGVGFSRVRV